MPATTDNLVSVTLGGGVPYVLLSISTYLRAYYYRTYPHQHYPHPD